MHQYQCLRRAGLAELWCFSTRSSNIKTSPSLSKQAFCQLHTYYYHHTTNLVCAIPSGGKARRRRKIRIRSDIYFQHYSNSQRLPSVSLGFTPLKLSTEKFGVCCRHRNIAISHTPLNESAMAKCYFISIRWVFAILCCHGKQIYFICVPNPSFTDTSELSGI